MIRAAAACNAFPSIESQRQLASYFCYPLVAGILDLADRDLLYSRGPTEDELLRCQPFISPQHLWPSHLFGTNYQGRAIFQMRDWY